MTDSGQFLSPPAEHAGAGGPALPHFPLMIDGQRAEAASGRVYETTDPYRGQAWATAADADARDVDRAVAAARRALSGPWGQLTGFGRARLLRRLGDIIARDADYLAGLETRDTGKLLREMRGQLAAIPEWFYYFAGLADKLEGAAIPSDKPNFLVYTRREPAGVVALAAHPGVDKIAFTGSTTVGGQIAKAAAENITGVLLELGGKSAHLVFGDADLDAVTNGVVAGVFAAAGQTCMAGSRLLVERGVHDQLVAKIVARAQVIKLGDPAAADTEMGPLANEAQYRKVLSFFAAAASEGATVAAGAKPAAELGGYFVRPTVLTNVKPE